MKKHLGSLIVAGGAFAYATPAFAGLPVGPAPVVAAGVPALIVIGAGYLIARKRRNH